MKDIELPPLPDLGSQWTPYWTKVVHKQMQAYARAAVEADRAQRVPGVEVALDRLASDAFRKGQLWERYQGKGWPEAESAEFCNLRDDAIPAAIASLSSMLASTPAQPAQQEPSEAEMVCAEAYQVVGCLLSDLGLFETEQARKILDNLSEARRVHQDVLPWESAATHQEPPQPVERKPMTRAQVKDLMESVGYEAATPQEKADFINGIRHAERHHGIKE